MACLFLGLPGPDGSLSYAQDDWSVKRRDRRPILIRRLKYMLLRNPHSKYSMNKLWLMHRRKSQRKQLFRYYTKKLQAAPKNVAYRIIMARLQERVGDWKLALQLYKSVQGKGKDNKALQLAKVRCYLGLKKPEPALAILKGVLKEMPTRQRKRMLLRMLRQLAPLKAPQAYAYVMTAIKKEKWSRDGTLDIARLLAQHQRWNDSFALYDKALPGISGQPRMLLLLEMLRYQLRADRNEEALKTIALARKMKTRNNWVRWELLQQEIVAYRSLKRLALLTAQLDRKWRKTKEFKKVHLLAQLYKELKVMSQAVVLYKRALKIRPRERDPRIQLLNYYTKKADIEKVRFHLRKLIQHKHATPKHYLRFANDLLKRSGKFRLPRWSPAWKTRAYCKTKKKPRYKYRRRRRYRRYYRRRRYRRPYRRKIERHKCSRQAWNTHRQKRWNFWKRYESTGRKDKMAQEASRILRDCAKRFRKQWDTLQKVEQLQNEFGYLTQSRQTRRKMIKALDAFVYRIEATHRLLFQEGEKQQLLRATQNALRPSSVPLKRAVEVSELVYKRPVSPGETTMKEAEEKRLQRRWFRKISSSIRRFLRPVAQRLKPMHVDQDPMLVMRLYALLWRTGVRSRSIRKKMKALERKLLVQPEMLYPTIQLYMRYRLKGSVKRLFQQLRKEHKDRWVSHITTAIRPSMQPTELSFFLKQLTANKGTLFRQAKAVSALVNKICQYKRSCEAASKLIETLSLLPQTPIDTTIAMLRQLQRHGLFSGSHKRDWLSQVIDVNKNDIEALNQLTEADDLFRYPSDARKLHQALMIFALERRLAAPANLYIWSRMLQYHLRRLKPRYSYQLTTIKRLDKAAAKFPSLYRLLLSFYLTNYNYRKEFGPAKLMTHLKKGITLDDLPYVKKVFYRLSKTKREALFSSILNRTTRPEVLGWMYTFAKEYRLSKLTVQILKRLLKQHPDDKHLIQQYALALDRSKDHANEAEKYWLSVLKKSPEKYTPAAIKSMGENCCADAADQRLLRRLLTLAANRHPLPKIWPLVKKYTAKLKGKQQRMLLQSYAALARTTKGYRLPLAQLAKTHKHFDVVTQVYEVLVKEPKTKAKWHLTLAQALDQQGHSWKANAEWKRYIKKARLSKPAQYFRKQAVKWKRQNPKMARLAYYRAWMFGPQDDPPTYEDVKLLQKQGKHLEAWAAWLFAQKAKGKRCLESARTLPPVSLQVAKQLWSLNAPYEGPLGVYSRCNWFLPKAVQAKLVGNLVSYMRKHPLAKIRLVGVSDPSIEPDVSFLADQRVESIARLLRSQGISDTRITTATLPAARFCDKSTASSVSGKDEKDELVKLLAMRALSNAKREAENSAIWCQSMRRHIGIYASNDPKPDTRTILQGDADQDGVPNAQDPCPLKAGRGYSNFRRRYRRSRRYRRYGRYRRYRRHSSVPGCPRYGQRLRLVQIKNNILKLNMQLSFYRNSPSIRYTGNKTLKEVAALLRLAPQLGALEIVMRPSFVPSYDKRRYRFRYRRRYRRRTRTARSNPYLARRRARKVRRYLRQQGIPSNRIKIRILSVSSPGDPKLPKQYLTLRFLPNAG